MPAATRLVIQNGLACQGDQGGGEEGRDFDDARPFGEAGDGLDGQIGRAHGDLAMHDHRVGEARWDPQGMALRHHPGPVLGGRHHQSGGGVEQLRPLVGVPLRAAAGHEGLGHHRDGAGHVLIILGPDGAHGFPVSRFALA